MALNGSCISVLFAVLLHGCTPASAVEIQVAVASNFQAPMQRIAEQFKRKTGHEVSLIPGASGKLYAQIINHAPYDLFLSADQEHPRKLSQMGLAIAGSEVTYALGRLALWSPRAGYVDASGEILKQAGFRHLSIANPKLAPYGVAAREVLEKLGLWEKLLPKLAMGENITQALQFVASGNAELGFVAFSQIKISTPGSYWLVPQQFYSPLKQDAILLTTASAKAPARELLVYLRSAEAQAVVREHGYEIP